MWQGLAVRPRPAVFYADWRSISPSLWVPLKITHSSWDRGRLRKCQDLERRASFYFLLWGEEGGVSVSPETQALPPQGCYLPGQRSPPVLPKYLSPTSLETSSAYQGPLPAPTLDLMVFKDIGHKHSKTKTALSGHDFVIVSMNKSV